MRSGGKTMVSGKRALLRISAGPRHVAGQLAMGVLALELMFPFLASLVMAITDISPDIDPIWLIIHYLGALLFIIWFRESYETVADMPGNDPSWSPGWAIGSWFIPLANLVLPYIVAEDMWKATRQDSARLRKWERPRVSPFVFIWWLFFIAFTITKIVFSGMPEVRTELDFTIAGNILAGLYVALLFCYGGLTIAFVYAVNSGLDRMSALRVGATRLRTRKSHWLDRMKWWHLPLAFLSTWVPIVLLLMINRFLPGLPKCLTIAVALLPSPLLIVWGIIRGLGSLTLLVLSLGGLLLAVILTVKFPIYGIPYCLALLVPLIWSIGGRMMGASTHQRS